MPSKTILALIAKHPEHGAAPEDEGYDKQPPPSPALVDATSEFIGHVHKQDAMQAAECFQTMLDVAGQGEQPQHEEPDGDEGTDGEPVPQGE